MSIQSALQYAHALIGLPYKWYKAGDPITGDEPFYAADLPPPLPADLQTEGKSIVCTGVANLLRRHVGLPVPAADADADIPYPGTTDAWFYYLNKQGLLTPFDIAAAQQGAYPAGSLLLRNFSNVETDQGHVAILIDSRSILHAYAYGDRPRPGIDGQCSITSLLSSHYYIPEGYYTHICLAPNWLYNPSNN